VSTTAKEADASSVAGIASSAQPPKKQLQAMWRVKHLRAQPPKKQVQAMRRVEHLRAKPSKNQAQAMRLGEHLRAQPPKKPVPKCSAEDSPIPALRSASFSPTLATFLSLPAQGKRCTVSWSAEYLHTLAFAVQNVPSRYSARVPVS